MGPRFLEMVTRQCVLQGITFHHTAGVMPDCIAADSNTDYRQRQIYLPVFFNRMHVIRGKNGNKTLKLQIVTHL